MPRKPRMATIEEIEKRVGELLDRPFISAKIQMDINENQVPTIRYDITELVAPSPTIKDDVKAASEQEAMTYGEIYEEFCNKFSNAEVNDYRPATPLYVDELNISIPNAIVVWLKDGSKIIYVSEVKG